jgi:hypothetical protein
MGIMNVEIRPVPDQNYEGRQWGYELVLESGTKFPVHTGGTGACWNIGEDPAAYADPDEADTIHVCELDELIAALQALRQSDVYRENYERWNK